MYVVNDGFIAEPDALVPAGARSASRQAPRGRGADDRRRRQLAHLARFPGIALILPPARSCCCATGAGAAPDISRRRRESHHPRRRWPRLRGGGDDDRRLRRRRLCPGRPAPRRDAAAHGGKDGLHVWIANGCGGCHTFQAAHSQRADRPRPRPVARRPGPRLRDARDRRSRTRMSRPTTPGRMPEDFASGSLPTTSTGWWTSSSRG